MAGTRRGLLLEKQDEGGENGNTIPQAHLDGNFGLKGVEWAGKWRVGAESGGQVVFG